MTTEELRSLLHRKVLRTDLKTEAYDGSSRAGVVQEGALTEASSEILGDLRAESVDPSALSRSGHRSIKSEASTTESENIDAKWLGLRDSGVNGSYLPRSGVGAHVSDWVESDILMATANSCGSGRARIVVCRSASNGYKSHQFWAGSRDDDMISAKIKVEFENVSTIGVEFGIMGAGFCDTVTGGFVPQNFNKLGAYPCVNSDVICDEYAFSGDKTVESAISDNLMAESLISCGNEVRPSNSSKIGPNSNSITNGPQNLSEIWPNSGEIVFGLAMNGAKLLKAGNKLEVGDWREDLHGQHFKSPTSSQQPLLLLVTRPIMHQEPNKMVTKGYDVIESVLFNFQAPITRGLVTVLFKSSGFCAPIDIPKFGLIAMGRSWRYSAAIT